MGILDSIAGPLRRRGVTWFHLSCVCAYGTALPLLCLGPIFSAVPLTIFIILCFAAPFFPAWSFYLDVHAGTGPESSSLSLTFDDGPDPLLTPAVLACLKKHCVRATFFVTGQKARSHPDIIASIVREGHAIGNHSNSHDICLMMRSMKTIKNEVLDCQTALKELGITSYVFRPPVGITNPRLAAVLRELELNCVNFTRRARDRGNRRIGSLSRRILSSVRGGDIVLLHDVHRKTFDVEEYIGQLDALIEGILKKGLTIVPLQDLLRIKVMSIDHDFFT